MRFKLCAQGHLTPGDRVNVSQLPGSKPNSYSYLILNDFMYIGSAPCVIKSL